jgi:tRNA-dihydrouridine synthase
MEGVTNFPMRLWFWLTSAPNVLATPFLRATATFPHKDIPETFAPELFMLRGRMNYNLVPQVMASDAADFIRSATLFTNEYPHIELNAGCPSPNCVGKGAGSSLLADPDDFARMIETISKTVGPTRFAVKMRTGFHSSDEFPSILYTLKNIELKRLTVHGRSRPQGYKGAANWQLISDAAANFDFPVFASGDVTGFEKLAANVSAYPNIRGVIIGRGALRNPWIFAELRAKEHQRVCRETVVYSLASFALLQNLYVTNFQALIGLALDGLFNKPCLSDSSAWKEVYETLATTTFSKTLDVNDQNFAQDFIVERKTAGRLKLVWNYLRSSLPEPFFEPKVLRSTSAGALLQNISQLFDSDKPVLLSYNANLDWIYNGEKNERQALIQKEQQKKSELILPAESCSPEES